MANTNCGTCDPFLDSVDDRVLDITSRANNVIDTLKTLSVKAKNVPEWDEFNIVADDMASLVIKSGGGGGGPGGSNDCSLDLTIKANNHITNANSWTLDRCNVPNSVLINSDTFVANTITSFDIRGAGAVTVSNEVVTANLDAQTVNIGATTLNITTTAGSVTIAGTTWQSILDRLGAVETAVGGKLDASAFTSHTHDYSDDNGNTVVTSTTTAPN